MQVSAIVLEIILALLFLIAGFSKLKDKKQIESFNHYGYAQWFRAVTGGVELVGAAGMIVGITLPVVAALAGIWLGLTMLGAVITHIRVKDPAKVMTIPFILLILNALVVIFQWHALVG